jgi:NAD-dependent DNA ligase
MENINYESLNKKQFHDLLFRLQEKYTNDEPEISDDEFDFLQKFYEKKFDTRWEYTGAKPRHGTAVTLPFPMPSQTKIFENELKVLLLWISKNPGPYIMEDKLDGCSLGYHCKNGIQKLYTRGNGIEGEDVSHLIPYLKLPIPNFDIDVRGELIITEDVFNKYVIEQKLKGSKRKLQKSRNIVAGLINAKESLDYDLLSKSLFVAYKYIKGPGSNGTTQECFDKLEEIGFIVCWYQPLNEIPTIELLSYYLTMRKGNTKIKQYKALYDIDGLILISDDIKGRNLVDSENRPKNSFAFKINTLFEVDVIDIEWNNSSKDGLIIPKILIKSANMLGSDVLKFTGFNAKQVISRNIGIGAKLLATLAGDIIPYVAKVIVPALPENMVYPDPNKGEYGWNKSGVNFILLNLDEHDDVKIAKIDYFVNTMDIKDFGIERIRLVYNAGFNTLYKIFDMIPENISELYGLGNKSAIKICENIKNAITDCMLYQIMAASSVFGRGFGSDRCKSVTDTYPDILDYANIDPLKLTEMIRNIEGFGKGKVNTPLFVAGLPKFVLWLKEHHQVTIRTNKIQNNIIYTDNDPLNALSGMRITVTGFVDYPPKVGGLLALLKSHNIEVNDLTKQSKLLIIKDESAKASNKVAKAAKYGTKVMTLDNFLQEYNINL